MNKKLINIKNMLRIIISLFVIFSFIKSCAKAAIIAPSQNEVDEININLEKVANYYNISNYPIYTTNNISKSTNTNKYCIFITENNSGWQANTIGAFFCGTNPLEPSYNGSQYIKNIGTSIKNFNTNQTIQLSDWSLTKSVKFKYLYTQVNWATSTGFTYQENNEYGAEIILKPDINIYFGHMFSEPYTYNGESIEANTLDYNYRIEYIENVVCEDTIITSMNATINDIPLTCNDLGTYWTLSLSNSTLLKYNTLYHIVVNAIIDGNEETIEESMIFVVPRDINRKWGYYKTTFWRF